MASVKIIGATGFVGQHLLDLLPSKHEVSVLVRSGSRGKISHDHIKIDEGDLLNPESIDSSLYGIDTVINLVGRFNPPFEHQIKYNVLAFNNLCEACVKVGVKKVIHVSAAAVYGVPREGQVFTENDQPRPDTQYALAKLLTEEVAQYYNRNAGLGFIILRPPNVYGPSSDHGVVHNFIKSAKETGEITIHGDGTQQRDFLYVEDLVDAVFKSLTYETKYEVFNISTNDPKNLNELVTSLGKVMGKEIKTNYRGEAQGAKVVTASFDKAKKLLSWKPKTSLEEGLAKTLA